jgi:hypothetical protein
MPRRKKTPEAHSSPARGGRISDKDMDRYMALLDEPGMTDAQKRQIIEAVNGIVQNVVDHAWGDDPVQLAIAARERDMAKPKR